MEGKKIGEITHYYSNISVGIIKLTDNLNVGDTVNIKGATTDFDQEIVEMQINHENIESAKKGDEIGIKVQDQVREGDEVFLK